MASAGFCPCASVLVVPAAEVPAHPSCDFSMPPARPPTSGIFFVSEAVPKFIPAVGGLAAGMLKSQLGCAGTSAAGTTKTLVQGQNPADAISSLGSLFKKKKP